MALNKVCICAIVLFFLIPLVGLLMHHFWKFLIVGTIISVIIGIVGFVKGDEILP